MKKLISSAIVGWGLVLSVFLSFTPLVSALAKPATSGASVGQALEISPPLITLTANRGQTVNAQILIRDVATDNLVVSNQINDFVANGENGTPKILIDSNSSINDPYTIKDWISPLPGFELAPEQLKTINMAIKVPADAAPGGHYGVIRFSGLPPSLESSGVSLSASLGVLVLLTVNGKLNDNLSISQFSVSSGTSGSGSVFQATPLNFIVKTKNSGDVAEQPTGYVTITDMFNHSVAEVNVNSPPFNVLPSSTRQFIGTLNSEQLGSRHLFGYFHAKIKLTYGVSTHKTLTASVSFWVIPYELIGIIIALIIAFFFVMRFLLRRYNRLIIQKAQGGNTRTATKNKNTPRSKGRRTSKR